MSSGSESPPPSPGPAPTPRWVPDDRDPPPFPLSQPLPVTEREPVRRRRHSIGDVASSYRLRTFADGVQELVKKTGEEWRAIKMRTVDSRCYRGDLDDPDGFIWPIYDPFQVIVLQHAKVLDSNTYTEFGLPVNLQVVRRWWAKIVYKKALTEPYQFFKYGSVTDKFRADLEKMKKEKKVKSLDKHRDRLKSTMQQLAKLLLVKKNGKGGRRKHGDVGWNWQLCERVFGQEIKDAVSRLTEAVRDGLYADSWSVDNISTAALTKYVESLGGPVWGCPTEATATLRSKATDLDRLLASPTVGPKIEEVVGNIASAIKTQRAKGMPIVRASVSPRNWAIHQHIAAAMVKDGHWIKRYAEYDRTPAVDLMNDRPNGQPSLAQCLVKAAEERSHLAATPLIEMEREYAYAPHVLSPSDGRFDREVVHQPTEELFEFLRSVKIESGKEAAANMPSHLLRLDHSSDELLKVNSDRTLSELMQAKQALCDMLSLPKEYLYRELDTLRPTIEKIRALVPKLRKRLKDCPVALAGSGEAGKYDDDHSDSSDESDASDDEEKNRSFGHKFALQQRRGTASTRFCYVSPPSPVEKVVAELRKGEEDLREQKAARTGTGADQYRRATETLQARKIGLTRIVPEVVSTMQRALDAELADADGAQKWANLAIEAIENSFYPSDNQGFSFKNVSGLVSRLKERVRFHLATHKSRHDAHVLIFDALVLSMMLPVPGHAFLWVERELARLFDEFRNSPSGPTHPALFASRLEADLIGVDVNMMVMTTAGPYSRTVLMTAWKKLDESNPSSNPSRLYMHVGFIQRLLDIQHGMCGSAWCRHLLDYDPRQKFNTGDMSRAALVSVQQLHVRGNIELDDGCPKFDAFVCLVVLGHYPYLRSIVNYVAYFIRLICATSRKSTGKHDILARMTMATQAAEEHAQLLATVEAEDDIEDSPLEVENVWEDKPDVPSDDDPMDGSYLVLDSAG